MDLDLVFNELSINSPAENIQTARFWMLTLIQTIRTAVVAGARRILRTYIDLNSILISSDYPIARWRNDPNVDLEARRYFRVLTTRCFPLTDLPEIDNKIVLHEFLLMHEKAYGLGVAYLLESLAVSFQSEARWDVNEIDQLEMQWISDDGNLSSDFIQVKHACNPQHVNELHEWIVNRLRTGIQSGEDLWNRRIELFPSLIFCENVKKEILYLQAGQPLLRQVVKRLFEIEDYCRNWESGPFDPEALSFKTTRESEATMNKYEKERTFTCQGNIEIIFRWHGRITPGAWRIYFDPEAGPGSIYIGYIGLKLPSVDYPT